jgi:hypothetical protein
MKRPFNLARHWFGPVYYAPSGALHEGCLTVDSEPGAGSTFHVYLPLPDVASPVVAAPRTDGMVVWWVSRRETVPGAVINFGQRRQLRLRICTRRHRGRRC